MAFKTLKEMVDAAKYEVKLPNDDGWVTVVNETDVYDIAEEYTKQIFKILEKSTPREIK